jgi:hypothetical protein
LQGRGVEIVSIGVQIMGFCLYLRVDQFGAARGWLEVANDGLVVVAHVNNDGVWLLLRDKEGTLGYIEESKRMR